MIKYTCDELYNIYKNLFYNSKLFVKCKLLYDFLREIYQDIDNPECINLLIVNNGTILNYIDHNKTYRILTKSQGHYFAKNENSNGFIVLEMNENYNTCSQNIDVNIEIEKIKCEINNIEDINIILDKINNDDEKLNYIKPDHVDDKINQRLYNNDNKSFGFCIDNIMTIDDFVCDYYVEILKKYNIIIYSEKYNENLNDDDLNIFDNSNNDEISKDYRYEIFIKIMLYNINLNVINYLQYLNFSIKNIVNNKKVDKNMYFNGIIENHIKKLNNEEINIYKLNPFEIVYVFTDYNINAVCKINTDYFYPNAYVLAKSIRDKKWNIFPIVSNTGNKNIFDFKTFSEDHNNFKKTNIPYIITTKFLKSQK